MRRLRREARELCSDHRYVDFGVRLFTVEQDPGGAEAIPGRPRVVRTRDPEDFGGIFDVRLGQWHDESANPVVWYASEEQRRLVLHGSDLADKIICRGAEGAGKTRGVVAPWALLRSMLDFAGQGVEIGATAPTMRRLETLRIALFEKMPPEWYSWRQRDGLLHLHCNVNLRLLSTHRTSEAEGSPVQGFDWVAWIGDEGQDQLHAMDDIRARGRRAPGGRYRQMMSVTVKDSPEYRAFEDKWAASPNSAVVPLSGFTNPFVAAEHWENLRQTLSERAYRRRVLAENVGSEHVTYHAWDRAQNLRPIPMLGAEDVTRQVLAPWGQNISVLVGHDPGKLCDVSLILKAYAVRGVALPVWWVVDEVTTEQTTTEQHVAALLARLRTRWGCNQLDWKGRVAEDGATALVRADPYSDSGNDEQRPDKSVYTIFRREGLRILPAATKPSTTVNSAARIPKEAGIDMINDLLCSASGVRRLLVACDEQRQPSAKKLVAALETSERDAAGKAETQKKDKSDVSHWPAALRYALWELERPGRRRQAA